jgi:hypothetical protein
MPLFLFEVSRRDDEQNHQNQNFDDFIHHKNIKKKTNKKKIIFKINILNIILLFGMAIAKRYFNK